MQLKRRPHKRGALHEIMDQLKSDPFLRLQNRPVIAIRFPLSRKNLNFNQPIPLLSFVPPQTCQMCQNAGHGGHASSLINNRIEAALSF